MLSRLEKKYDETLTEYFRAFMAMCKRQCGIRLSEEENESKYDLCIVILWICNSWVFYPLSLTLCLHEFIFKSIVFFTELLEVGVDRLPEERARRVLERVDLLNRLRNDVLPHPALKDALELALPSKDMPDWWIPGKHDHDLLKGVSR